MSEAVKDHREMAQRAGCEPAYLAWRQRCRGTRMEVCSMSTYLPTIFGENLMDVFDDFDRNFFRGWGNVDRELYGKHARHMMKTDVKEVENGYEVDIDLPGFKKDEITLELKDGYLTISAQKAVEKDNEKHGRMLRQERYAGMMQRSFYVGEHITEEDVKASYESGVLHLVIPKKDAPKMPEKKVIQIEG